MSLENAEIAKIAVNTFVTTKISYANMLAQICEHVPNTDVSIITSAIGLDARIGRRYLGTGLGYGGPCFPRDNKALAVFAKKVGASAHIAQATDKVNESQAERLVQRIKSLCHSSKKGEKMIAAVLGLSYKQDTDVTEKSQGVQIAKKISSDKKTYAGLCVFDRAGAMRSARKILGTVNYSASLNEAVAQADVVIIAIADRRLIPQFSALKNGGNGIIIVDPWRLIEASSLPNGSIYLTVGKYTV